MEITDIKKLAAMGSPALFELVEKQTFAVDGSTSGHDYVYTMTMNDWQIADATTNIDDLDQADYDDLEGWVIDREKSALVETIQDILQTPVEDLENYQLEILQALNMKEVV